MSRPKALHCLPLNSQTLFALPLTKDEFSQRAQSKNELLARDVLGVLGAGNPHLEKDIFRASLQNLPRNTEKFSLAMIHG